MIIGQRFGKRIERIYARDIYLEIIKYDSSNSFLNRSMISES